MEPVLTYLKENPRINQSYKFELGGLLVYDVKAEISVSEKPSESQDLPQKFSQKDLQFLSRSKALDYSQSVLLKAYPPCGYYPIDYAFSFPQDSTTLLFDSRFESGNLSKAVKMSDYEYKLYINNDIGTYNCNHWFYFSVKNKRKTNITFKIVNMRKKDNLFQEGMKPAVYSLGLEKAQGVRWHRDGTGITYSENISTASQKHKSYSLTFSYSFKYENDTVFFAYSTPYTYSDLQDYLAFLLACYPDILKVATLCETLAGNLCQVITITDSIDDYFPSDLETKIWACSENNRKKLAKNLAQKNKKIYNEEKHKNKVGVVLMARVHSGETVSSFMLKGAIDYLTSSSAKSLRKNFVFKIVPMLNPDGVRYGSYRNSLLGVDLNRRWHRPSRLLHPEIFHTKVMIKSFNLINDVKLVCDMHGHTKKFNVFMYGCCSAAESLADSQRNLMAKSIPYMISINNKFFSMNNSHFRMEAYKETTARIVLYNELKLPHSYTIESSFYGYQDGKKIKQFSEIDLENIGKTLCKVCNSLSSNRRYAEMLIKTNEFLRSTVFDYPKQRIRKTWSRCENLAEDIREEEEENLTLNSEENSPYIEDSCSDQMEFEDIPEDHWWQRIDIVDIQPDSDSSGSESEISDAETLVKKKPKEKIELKKTAASPPSAKKVKTLPQKRFSKPVNTKQQRKLESLNLGIFNFPSDISEAPTRKSFEAGKVVKKEARRPCEKNRRSFLLPVLKTHNNRSFNFSDCLARKEFSQVINEAAKFIQSSSHFQGKSRTSSI